MSRFVVLHHVPESTLGSQRTTQPHFDWMFELDGSLHTIATPPLDFDEPKLELPATLLAPHRLAYLEYEGLISAGRGSVERLVRGTFELLRDDGQAFVAQILWHRLRAPQKATITFQVASDQRNDPSSLCRGTFVFESNSKETKR